MNGDRLITELKRNPDCLLQDLDLVNQRALLVRISETDYRGASFLDHRVFKPDTVGGWFLVSRLLRETVDVPLSQPLHAIFHVSHCGSTLLSRLLVELQGCLPVREPLPLIGLALARREMPLPTARVDPAAWDTLFDMSLRLYSRGYHSGPGVLLKTTSVCANLLPVFLGHSKPSRALMLYIDLETWLATMLRAEVIRENGRVYAPAWLTDFNGLTGRELRFSALTEAERFALNWLAGMLHFERARVATPERVLAWNFEEFLAGPAASLRYAAEFLGYAAARAEELSTGPLMKSYAKNLKQPFDETRRRGELAESHKQFGAEIREGLSYAEKLAGEIPALAPLGEHFRRRS